MALNRTSIAAGTTGAVPIGGGGDNVVTSVVFQLTQASGSFSVTPQAFVEQTANTAQNVQYVNLATGAVASAGTAITTAGIYGVFAPGLSVQLNVTSVATSPLVVDAAWVAGRVL